MQIHTTVEKQWNIAECKTKSHALPFQQGHQCVFQFSRNNVSKRLTSKNKKMFSNQQHWLNVIASVSYVSAKAMYNVR